ncbi:hypothetical protein Ac2012v2_8341 [Leucoagaricus gongylophorus]
MEKALVKAKKELRKQNSRHRQFSQVSINDRDDPAMYMTFIISYLLDYTVRMPFGKATQVMRGWDMEANSMVYIKDYWRAEGGEKEGEMYRSLEENNVPKISRSYCVMKYARQYLSRRARDSVANQKIKLGLSQDRLCQTLSNGFRPGW